MIEVSLRFVPLLATVTLVAGFLSGLNWLMLVRPKALENSQRFYRQLLMIGLTLIGVLAVVLALPVPDTTRNQIIGLLGLVISGAIAFSSTTIIANLMAGIMMRVTRPFRTGDYISIDDKFGRVTERGLLDTEIQTEKRELVSLPNSFLITRPVSVVRSSGAMVSVQLSLGYDVHHTRIERLLLQAAQECGLRGGFVQVLELGDFSVTYRVNGLLEDVKGLLTARSNLSRNVLDVLHDDGVEIVSPGFMNQRPLDPAKPVIARSKGDQAARPTRRAAAEDVVFDKAEEAEKTEKRRKECVREIEEIEEALKTAEADERNRLQERLERAQAEIKAIDEAAAKEGAEKEKT